MRVPRLAVTLTALAICGHAAAEPGEASFTPTSMIVPLYEVQLANVQGNFGDPSAADMSAFSVYHCYSAEDANKCQVDMADFAAVAELFETLQATPGQYDAIVLYTCPFGVGAMPKGTSYTVKGSFSSGGATYYTSAGSEPLTMDAKQEGYLSLDAAGCSYVFPLQSKLTIQVGDAVELNAFYSLKNLVMAKVDQRSGSLTPLPGSGCAVNSDKTASICAGIPHLALYNGNTAPTLHDFMLTSDVHDAAGKIGRAHV